MPRPSGGETPQLDPVGHLTQSNKKKSQYKIEVQIKEKNKILEEKDTERFDKKITNYELQREQPLRPSARILLRLSLRIWALKQLTVDLSSFAALLQSFGSMGPVMELNVLHT